jgi:hypothetical protein
MLFIDILKEIRGTQFDANGIPTNGMWFDIKSWHTESMQSQTDIVSKAQEVADAVDSISAYYGTIEVISSDIQQGGTNFINSVAQDLQTNNYLSTVGADLLAGALSNVKTVATNMQYIVDAKSNADSAATSAQAAQNSLDQITSLNADAQQLVSNEEPTAMYNPTTGTIVFGIPQGLKGDRGEAFTIDARGTLAQRDAYDGASEDFSFFASDSKMIYFKLSDTDGDWDEGSPFGRGDDGLSISVLEFVSTTDASGLEAQAGATDTYRAKLSDGTIVGVVNIKNGIASNSNLNSLGDIVIPNNTNRILAQPVVFDSLTIGDNSTVKFI